VAWLILLPAPKALHLHSTLAWVGREMITSVLIERNAKKIDPAWQTGHVIMYITSAHAPPVEAHVEEGKKLLQASRCNCSLVRNPVLY
jgi:hypothetical protein